MSLKIGLIGCGDISEVYLVGAARFRDIAFTACADLKPEAARRKAEGHGIAARTVKELLASDDVDIVVNLTIPEAHAEVSLAALAAGKHVYTEKPLATTLADGLVIAAAAKTGGLRVGSAPDTMLGAAPRAARELIDSGAIGRPLTGLAAVLDHGMEHWHPNPGFFFRPGGGPVFDMGPYYLTALVHLLGPIASVQAAGQIGFAERVVTRPGSTVPVETIRVEVLTSVQGLLEFASGAQVTFLASWDVWKSDLPPLELHGETASLRLPDPNFFGGEIRIAEGRADWRGIATTDRTFGGVNWPPAKPRAANFRGLGLADMARGILDARPHRANGDVALHVLAVMAGLVQAATERSVVAITPTCERPAPLGEAEAAGLLA
jgi:predicted dehydrogenase